MLKFVLISAKFVLISAKFVLISAKFVPISAKTCTYQREKRPISAKCDTPLPSGRDPLVGQPPAGAGGAEGVGVGKYVRMSKRSQFRAYLGSRIISEILD